VSKNINRHDRTNTVKTAKKNNEPPEVYVYEDIIPLKLYLRKQCLYNKLSYKSCFIAIRNSQKVFFCQSKFQGMYEYVYDF
jgi:hypothetical protein